MSKDKKDTIHNQKTLNELKLDAEDLLNKFDHYDQLIDELIKKFLKQNCEGKFSELLIDDVDEFKKALTTLMTSRVCLITRFSSQFM
jgi:hypothetical protein